MNGSSRAFFFRKKGTIIILGHKNFLNEYSYIIKFRCTCYLHDAESKENNQTFYFYRTGGFKANFEENKCIENITLLLKLVLNIHLPNTEAF